MQIFSASPAQMIRSLIAHRELIKSLSQREIAARYQGSVLGLAWSFVFPLLMLGIYTFVFSEVFKARWSAGNDSKTEFALVLFAGLIVFSLFSEAINRAPSLILSHTNYVKKVVFPLEILPLVIVAQSLFSMLTNFLVWLVAYIVFFGMPHLTILLLPVVLLPLIFLTLGVCWFLASIGVFLRDIGQLMGVFTTALMFMSPIFFPVSSIPEKYRFVFYLNPLTPAVESARDVLYWGKIPNLNLLLIAWIISLLVAWLGFAWFQRTRKGFADVL